MSAHYSNNSEIDAAIEKYRYLDQETRRPECRLSPSPLWGIFVSSPFKRGNGLSWASHDPEVLHSSSMNKREPSGLH